MLTEEQPTETLEHLGQLGRVRAFLQVGTLGLLTFLAGCVVLLFAGCAAPHAYIGVQTVAPFDSVQDSRFPDNTSAYVNLLFPLGERWSFQLQPIVPLDTRQEPLLRLAVDYKLF